MRGRKHRKMKRISIFGWMAAVSALAFVGGERPAAAQRQEDVGRQIEREYGVVGDNTRDGRRYNALLDDVVARITQAVNAESHKGDFRLQSAKLLGGRDAKHDEVVNAFALPDGRIYVTLGLMRMIDGSPTMEDELAFVVAHEMTHVAERHGIGQQKKSLPYILGAILLGTATKNRTLGQAGGLLASAKVASFSRKDEYSADRGGLLAMNRAGYDLSGAPKMLRRLGEKSGKQNKTITGIWGTHPISENRVSRVKEMIADIRAGRDPDDDDGDRDQDRDRDRDRNRHRGR